MILVNALSAQEGGGQTYLIHLLESIPDFLTNKVIVLAGKRNAHVFQSYPVKIIVPELASKSVFHRSFFENFHLKKLLIDEKVTVYFSAAGLLPKWRVPGLRFAPVFQNQLPFASEERRRFPHGYLRTKLLLLKYLQIGALGRADLAIFLTEYSKNAILRQAKKQPPKTVVIPHGIDEYFRTGRQYEKPANLPDEYVFYVSNIYVYKAQLEVVQSWHLMRQKRKATEKLVFVGPEDPNYKAKVVAKINELGLQDEVLILGKVPYRDLPAYYQHAKLHLYASSCETFGIILLEKLASGVPVLCSNYQPFPEIAGDGVAYFDPYKPETLADLLHQYLDDPSARKELAERGLKVSEKYSWPETAAKTWKALGDLME